jgi:hypothetical protein
MQMPAVGVEQRARVALARDDGAQLVAADEPQRAVVVVVRQVVELLAQLVVVPLLEADDHVAGHVVAVDGVLRDELALQPHAFDGDVPHAARVGRAHGLLERRLLAGIAEDGLAPAAPGASEAQVFGLEQHHFVTALAQMQRGRQPRDAAAHDADVGGRGARERRIWRLARRGRDVVVPGVVVTHGRGARSAARYRGPR